MALRLFADKVHFVGCDCFMKIAIISFLENENLVRKILKIIRDNISVSSFDDLPCYGHSLQTMAVGECDSGSRSGMWA